MVEGQVLDVVFDPAVLADESVASVDVRPGKADPVARDFHPPGQPQHRRQGKDVGGRPDVPFVTFDQFGLVEQYQSDRLLPRDDPQGFIRRVQE